MTVSTCSWMHLITNGRHRNMHKASLMRRSSQKNCNRLGSEALVDPFFPKQRQKCSSSHKWRTPCWVYLTSHSLPCRIPKHTATSYIPQLKTFPQRHSFTAKRCSQLSQIKSEESYLEHFNYSHKRHKLNIQSPLQRVCQLNISYIAQS